MLAARSIARVGLAQRIASSIKVTAPQALRKHTILAGVPTPCQPCSECFKVLKIPPVASLADVTEAYHQQALRWLPEYELEDPEVAEKTFEKLLGAYQMLTRQFESDSEEVLADAGRSLLADRHLPELPLINDRNDLHGIALLGGKSSGKTSLICSLLAVHHGKYPHSNDYKEKLREMSAYGNSWDFPEREICYVSGEIRQMRVVLTDTPPCGMNPREEQPICANISPNSHLHYSAVPSWMRIILRSLAAIASMSPKQKAVGEIAVADLEVGVPLDALVCHQCNAKMVLRRNRVSGNPFFACERFLLTKCSFTRTADVGLEILNGRVSGAKRFPYGSE
eukprot:g17002.t1